MDRRPIVGGNWKMNTAQKGAAELARSVVDGLNGFDRGEVVVFPPFPYLMTVGAVLRERGSWVHLGAQDVWHQPDGAFTGEVSVSMLRDCGVQWVLTGHSERRHVIGESDDLINQKTKAVLEADMSCILCIGETLAQRESGDTNSVNERQLKAALNEVDKDSMSRLVIAYEPVWAIGTGRTASPEDAQSAHAFIREWLGKKFGSEIAENMRIQYGGSVKPTNASELFASPDIDGGLIGGASLKASDFVSIVKAV